MSEFDYDLFVIGAGSGGVRACRVAATLGARVAVAEERYFGGTCVNVGCVPKKLFSYAAHYRDDLEDSRGFGWDTADTRFDWNILKRNKDNEIKRLNGIYKSILDSNGVTVFQQRARLTGPHEVSVGERRVSARYILLAVGGWPWIPEFPGSRYAVSSNEVFQLQTLPDAVTVIGGGYIAVEFASIFARLGCETSLVYRRDKLLRGFDEEVRSFLTRQIGAHLKLYLEDDILEISRNDSVLQVNLESGTQVQCQLVLSATGRRPLTDDLGLEHVAVKLSDSGAIEVNERFQTGEPPIYAVGDAIDRVALTPVALAEGQIVARALFGGSQGLVSYDTIPTAVFCHPNVATCGLTEEAAQAKGLDIDVYSATVRQLKHTLSGRDELSLIKLIVDKPTDKVVGAHIVAPDAGELMQGIAIAMNAGATKAQFDATIGIHPTLAEEVVTMREARKDHSEGRSR